MASPLLCYPSPAWTNPSLGCSSPFPGIHSPRLHCHHPIVVGRQQLPMPVPTAAQPVATPIATPVATPVVTPIAYPMALPVASPVAVPIAYPRSFPLAVPHFVPAPFSNWPKAVTPHNHQPPQLFPPFGLPLRPPPQQLSISPYLHYSVVNHYRPSIIFDVSLDPRSPRNAVFGTRIPALPIDFESAPMCGYDADQVLDLAIIAPTPTLLPQVNWPPIRLSRRRGEHVFMIAQLFREIYDWMHTPLTEQEQLVAQMNIAQLDAARRSRLEREGNTVGDLVRSDAFGIHTFFSGLHPGSVRGYGQYEITLYLMPRPGSV